MSSEINLIEEGKRIKVKNRRVAEVGYDIPDLSLTRNFQPGEEKLISYNELFKLSQVPGGEYIIKNYLIIEDEEVIENLLNHVEPEYFYTEEQIVKLMTTGTLDEFDDCLTFAPAGVIDLIKMVAVKLPLNDISKRDLILKKTGFNVASAIEFSVEEKPAPAAQKRKAGLPTAKKDGLPTRKAQVPSKEDK